MSIHNLDKYLRPEASALLHEVESAFGKTVDHEIVNNYKPNEHGKATIGNDGTPIIKTNASTDDLERTIVHELFHLKFRVDGYGDINYCFPGLRINTEVLHSIDNTFLQTVEHWMFFPAIRKMGIDPTSHHKANLRSGEYKSLDVTDVRNLSYRYYDTHLLVDDADLVRDLANWYKEKGLTAAISKGEELCDIVLSSKPKTPDEEISTYVKVLNAVPENTARFCFQSWKETMVGSFKWRIAIILISANR